MNINGSKDNKTLINDGWSKNAGKRLNVSFKATLIPLVVGLINCIILLAGMDLSQRKSGSSLSSGIFDRVSTIKTYGHNMYDSRWLGYAIIFLVCMGIGMIWLALRFNRVPGVIDSVGLSAPIVAIIALIIGAVMNCGGGADSVSHSGLTYYEVDKVTVSGGFVFCIILAVVFIFLYVADINARTQLANDNDFVDENVEKVKKTQPKQDDSNSPQYRSADDFFNNKL